MWYLWTTLLVLSCALGTSAEDAGALNEQTTKAPEPLAATTRSPPRTLDRKSAELAWRNWLQSPESGNQNAPPRRITTKSLFITPLVCPKGQRLDRNGCVQVVTVDKDEHERILLEQLNALFTSSPSGDVLYDYDENEPGPLQLSIPIGLDPQAAPLQAQEPSGQAQELQPSYVKVDTNEKPNTDASIEAELEILKLGHQTPRNDTASPITKDDLHHNMLNNYLPFGEKPKRDSSTVNQTASDNSTEDLGQKEVVYGHVNVDPVEYDTNYKNPSDNWSKPEITLQNDTLPINDDTVVPPNNNFTDFNKTTVNETMTAPSKHHQELKKDDDNAKLSPENEYSNIGEAIKLISRYAEVTTDDNFAKDNKHTENDDSILGTRTKLQHRRKIPKKPEFSKEYKMEINRKVPDYTYYRYSWPSRESVAPQSGYPYPFRHLQDYWPGKTQAGGVYNTLNENPRRHHHSYFYPRNLRNPYGGFPGQYPGLQHFNPQYQGYPRHRMSQHHSKLIRSYTNNQDLYSLLGLRHWFSGEGASKR